MRYAVGIDLGTTFTSAAVADPRGTRVAPLSPAIVVPSLAYHAPDGRLLTGAAVRDGADDPARLGRGFKRRLGDPTPLMLGGAAYSPAALMAAQLRAVLDQVTASMGAPPASIVLTCPAIWGPYRREQFAEVPRLAGVGDVRLVTEPEAAATHYSRERALGEGEVVAVYDLGGGTLDTTVLRMRADGMEILGTPEGVEHLGGMDFDDALLAHVDTRLDGAITQLDPNDREVAAALAGIRAQCVRAKIDLTTEPDVTLTVALPSDPRELTITRQEFNDVIRPSVELTISALRRTITSAGLRDEDVSAVLLAGGSSRVPLVTQRVFEEFDKPVRVAQHPKFTVALGAATIAERALATPPPALTVPGPSGPVGPTTAEVSPAERERGRRWLVPTAAAVLLLVAALVVTLVVGKDSPTAQPSEGAADTTSERAGDSSTTEPKQPAGPASELEPLAVFGDAPAGQYRAFIASNDNWEGKEIVGRTASHAAISATIDDGLRVTWRGGSPAQVYLQTVSGPRDLTSYVDNGALVFDVELEEPATGNVTISTHCLYPCGAELDATALFGQLPAGERRTVSIPVNCFTAKGLNPAIVNTPFLIYADGPLDATFRDISWVPNAGSDPGTTPCGALS